MVKLNLLNLFLFKKNTFIKSKKGVVFTILGAFTLVGIMYLFMVFLDLFNVMYTQTTFQGDVRASSLHAANFYDEFLTGKGVMFVKTGYSYPTDQTAEYNAKKLFDINYQNHYRIVKNSAPTDFSINSNNPNLKVTVFNLAPNSNGGYDPQTEVTPYGIQTHTIPGVSVSVSVPLKSWTFFFKNYDVKVYSYSSPVDTTR
jgi:hypothetical protein